VVAASQSSPLVTILVPNWNTGPLLRLCLASVVRFTRVPHRLVVVDNASDDASRATAEAAEAAGLIELLRRDDAKNEGAEDHGKALDLGLSKVETPLVMTLDSDAWARQEGWLEEYVQALGDADSAGATKFPGGLGKTLWLRLRGAPPRPEASYVRPCHALYRVATLREHGLSFRPHQLPSGQFQTCGEHLHQRLLELGRTPVIMPHKQVESLVGHLRHATFVINAERFPSLRRRAKRRGERKIERWLASREAARILEGSPIP
jgi:glycosyltransferase involved in cell wall biosynthesis